MKTDDTLIASVDSALLADLDPYRLLREIGRGGMSVVYEALDTRTGQRVALKILSLPFAVTAARRTDLVARFRREERAVSQLSHPNIVAIQEIGERAGVHFIAMEYLPGESLRARLERGPLPLPEAGAILTQIAAALTAVHGAGIVHRDVKPSNVMLLPDGGAKLLDFGVARHADDTAITSGGLVVGSPAYLSPEQVRGGAGTTASDIWALGVLLYEMLVGHPPFQATDVAAVMYQVIHEPPRPVPGLPPAVAKVLKRALDKAPERRFSSAQSLADAFSAAQPAAAPAPSVRPAALPRWAWAMLPLLFLAAVLASFSARHTLFPPPTTPTAASAPVPAVTVPAVSAPPAIVLPAAVRRTAKPAVPSTRAVPPLLAETPPAAPVTFETGTVPSRPAAARRPRPARPQAATRPLPPSVAAVLPPRHPAVAHVKPAPQTVAKNSASEAPAAPALPREAPAPTPFRPAVPAAKSRAAHKKEQDDEAAEAERLQKFIWSEGR